MRADRDTVLRAVNPHEAGISMLETSVVMVVVLLMGAAVAPVVLRTIDAARSARANREARALAEALELMLDDVGERFVLRRGHGRARTDAPDRHDDNRVRLLVSPGGIPGAPATPGSTTGAPAPAASADWFDRLDRAGVMSFDDHLVANEPGYRSPAQMTALLPPGGDGPESRGFGWRGAYLRTPIGPDPWGHRYAANVALLGEEPSRIGSAPPRDPQVMVLSAGPNGRIDTPFAADGTGLADDLTVLVNGPP